MNISIRRQVKYIITIFFINFHQFIYYLNKKNYIIKINIDNIESLIM
jgi:hypothetical protein